MMRLEEMISNSIILAVHPHYVIDAASAAASRWSESPQKYGPQRMQILINYIKKFKIFIRNKAEQNVLIIITSMGEPITLHNWYDQEAHWEQETDKVKIGQEQEQVYQIYKDLVDFIHEIAHNQNVHIMSEDQAGQILNSEKFINVIKKAKTNKIQILGGNLSGCLQRSIKMIEKLPNPPEIHVVTELTFDDDSKFWDRHV